MTYKNGFLAGLGFGFFAWLILQGVIVFTPNPLLVRDLVYFIGAIFFVSSVILGIEWAIKGKASFLKTTGDGFVYGFTTAFDVLFIVVHIIQGQMPFSVESILLMIL